MALPSEVDTFLKQSLADHRVSRSERQALASAIERLGRAFDPHEFRRRILALGREALADDSTMNGTQLDGVFEWMDALLKAGIPDPPSADGPRAEAHFSPGDACWTRIGQLFDRAKRSAEVCVFTITDDRISSRILAAHERGVEVAVITDDDKASDEGSDIDRLSRAGIPVLVDRTPWHMHHKFAVFDGQVLVSGSYNWTRGAAQNNNENIIVSTDDHLVGLFTTAFRELWERLS